MPQPPAVPSHASDGTPFSAACVSPKACLRAAAFVKGRPSVTRDGVGCAGGHPSARVLTGHSGCTNRTAQADGSNGGPSLLTGPEAGSPRSGVAQLGSQGRPSAWSQVPPSHCVPVPRREREPRSPQLLIQVLILTGPTLMAWSKPSPLPKAPPPNTVPRVDRGTPPAGTSPPRPVAGPGHPVPLPARRKFALRHLRAELPTAGRRPCVQHVAAPLGPQLLRAALGRRPGSVHRDIRTEHPGTRAV